MTGATVGQVRGVLAERVVLSSALDPFLGLRALAAYSGLSVRTLRTLLTRDLPHYRIGTKVLVRRSDFDAWMARYRRVGRPDVAGLVDEVLRDLRP
jgi:excisionase family DNA binding protein